MNNETTERNVKIIKPQKGFQEQFTRSSLDVVIGGGVLNCGKAQPIDSQILTPNGFVRMGDLKVGDEICGSNGNIQRVLNIFERGELDTYKITFDDDTIVECCPEHLWTVWDSKKRVYITIEAQEILKNGIERYRVSPISAALQYSKKKLSIHPYLLGVLLGDGMMGRESASISVTTDEEIIDYIKEYCNVDIRKLNLRDKKNYKTASIVGSEFRGKLRQLGLFGKKSSDKFIPYEYLYATKEERTELLLGLFDTDGYNDKKSSRIEYSTTSPKLANDVTLLVKSLGGVVYKSEAIGSYMSGKRVYCKKVYRLQCRFKNPNDMFRLKRKKTGLEAKKMFFNKFARFEYVGKKEMRCIVVSNEDHLYITDGFNLTHNSFAAILATAEPSLDPSFRACFTRRTFGELRSGGSLTDDFKVAFGDGITLKTTDPPRVTFPSGALVDFRQINDESIKKVTETWKGSQYDLIYMDELTSYEFSTFKYLMTRNRGKAKWSGKFRGTTNPEKDCWVRTFIDWYIGADGLIREDRNGVVRYFYLQGETVEDVVWGDSKEEVYSKCKDDIDRKLKALGGDFTYKNMIKSFTFYLGRMSENKASIGNNMDYAGSVAAVGGRQAQQLVEGNWNCSLKDDNEMPIPYSIADSVFNNDPRVNGDKWITADLADTGTDNTMILVWNGLHIIDYKILCKSTPAMNVEYLKVMAKKHDIPDNHIIYDAVRAAYVYDYIPDAVGFKSYSRTLANSKYGRMYYNMKDDCYARLVEVIRRGMLSFEDKIANDEYVHQKIKNQISIKVEFIEECLVVKFKELPGGKSTLLNKKEMNHQLGKGRSMDLLDPIAMRMLPLLIYEYGQELIETEIHQEEKKDYSGLNANIYNDDTWC